jgi:uncharacterized repeat protein (TIGR01451 family)
MKHHTIVWGILLAILFLTLWLTTSANAALYPLHPGFPIETEGRVRASPVVADLDNDGRNELLVANYGGKLFAWNAAGSPRPGFPFNSGGLIVGEIALADLNQNGDLEIVAGVSSTTPGLPGHVLVWQHNGALLSGWPQSVDLFDQNDTSEISTVVLADIDRDADLEIIAGTDNNIVGTSAPPGTDVPDLYVWHHTGQLAAGNWPAKDGPSIKGAIAAGDMNADGQTDILVGRDYQFLFAYDNRGNSLPGWPVETLVSLTGNHSTVPRIAHKRSMPSLADLDGDGQVEVIVAGVRKLPKADDAFNTDLLVLQPNGSRRPGWEVPAGGVGLLGADVEMDQGPAIADLDNDGQLDIIVPTQDGWIRAYKANKSLLWQFNFAQGQQLYSSEPVIGDIDADGRYEVLFGTYDPTNGSAGPVGLWILEHDGVVKGGAPLSVEAPGIMAAPTLADLDGDGHLDIVAASRTGSLYAWDTGSPFNPARLPWPVARQNTQRTAFVDPTGLSTSAKTTSTPTAEQGEIITYKLRLVRVGLPLTKPVQVTDVIPEGLKYVAGSLKATHGVPDDSNPKTLKWAGLLPATNLVEISYDVRVTESSTLLIVNSALIDVVDVGQIIRRAYVIINPKKAYLPLINRSP